jgi:hypothetical protein
MGTPIPRYYLENQELVWTAQEGISVFLNLFSFHQPLNL